MSVRIVIMVGAKLVALAGYLYTRRFKSALATMRKANNDCLHLLVEDGGLSGESFRDISGGRDINANVGMIFRALDCTFYHPDPAFTPNHEVEWLARSTWASGGLEKPEDAIVPVSTVGSGNTPFEKYKTRHLARDRAGGSSNPGACSLCSGKC